MSLTKGKVTKIEDVPNMEKWLILGTGNATTLIVKYYLG